LEIEAFFCAGKELLSVVLLHLLDHVLINWVNKIKYLIAALSKAFNEGRGRNGGARLASNIIDTLLALFHAGDVVLERNLVIT